MGALSDYINRNSSGAVNPNTLLPVGAPLTSPDTTGSIAEPLATIATGAIAEPLAGWAGMLTGNPDNVGKVREALTYQPRTDAGKQSLQDIGTVFRKLGESAKSIPGVTPALQGYDDLSDYAGDIHPALGAAMRTLPTAAMMFAGPGSTATREAFGSVGRGAAEAGAGSIENYLSDLGLTQYMVDPKMVPTRPKRMPATNAAIANGGDVANGTARDYTTLMDTARAKVASGDAESLPQASRLTPNEVKQRRELAGAVLSQPLEKWTPPANSLLDRSVMDTIPNQGGVPGVDQVDLERYVPGRADISHVDSMLDPRNLDIIRQATQRGLAATNGGFYKSFQPMRAAMLDYGYSPEEFQHAAAATSFASAKNSVALENAIGSLLMRMKNAGIPINADTISAAKAAFADTHGTGLSLMQGHYEPFARYLDSGEFPNGFDKTQKIASFYNAKLGNYRPYTLDTHEGAGLYYGTPYSPYFWDAGGFGKTEYGRAEQLVKEHVADKLGIDPAVAQEGRWFGMGELTGLKTGGGDWLDNYEKQAAWSAHQLGMPMDRESLRRYTVDAFAGRQPLLPWWSKDPIPDMRPFPPTR